MNTVPLLNVIRKLRRVVDQQFGTDTPIRVVQFHDPEDSSSKTFALIVTRLPAGEAMPKLDAIDDTWWFDQNTEIHLAMSVDIEYV